MGRRLAAIPLFLLVAAALLLGNLWAFLRTPVGARILAHQLEERLGAAILGSIRIGELGTFGVAGFHLRHVLILDPDGEPVIAAERVRVHLAARPLLAGRLEPAIEIDGGRMALVRLPRWNDVNVGVAFRPARPRPRRLRHRVPVAERKPLPPDPPVPIVLRRLQIRQTAFLFSQSPEAKPLAAVRGIRVDAHGRWHDGLAHVVLVLEGEALRPVREPLTVAVEGVFAESWLDAVGVDVALGPTALHVVGRGHMQALEGRIQARGSVDASQARSLGIPLHGLVDLEADIWLAGDLSSVSLRASQLPAGGVVAVDGWIAPAEGTFYLHTLLGGVDPGAWVVGAPSGGWSGSLRAEGRYRPGPDLALAIELPAGSVDGVAVGPIGVRARFDGEGLRFAPSHLSLPGLVLRLEGSAAPRLLDLRARIEASGLERTVRFAERFLGDLPALGGNGTLDLGVEGSPRRPHLAVRLEAPALRWPGGAARALRLVGSGGLDEEGLPAGRIEADASSLRIGRRRADRFRLFAERDAAGSFRLGIGGRPADSGEPAQRLRLEASGSLKPGLLALDRFRLAHPRGGLVSQGRSLLHFGGGRWVLEGLDLHQVEGGFLHLDGSLDREGIALRLDGHGILLDRLPRALLPADSAGRLDLDAELEGPLASPLGRASFSLRGGRFGTLRDLAASGSVRFAAGRGEGEVLAAAGGIGRLEGRFSLPLDLRRAPPDEPVALDLLVAPLFVDGLGRAIGRTLPRGEARMRLFATGTVGLPRIEADLFVSDVDFPEAPGLPTLALELHGRVEEGDASAVLLARAADTLVADLLAAVPFDLRRLRAAPGEELSRMLRSPRSRAKGVVRGLDLGLVGEAIGDPALAGAVVAEFDLRGPILDPRGELHVEARGGPVGPVRHLDLALLARFGADRSSLLAGIGLAGLPPAELRLQVDAPPRAFLDGTAPPETPASFALRLPPLDLASLGGAAPIQGAAAGPSLAGRISGDGSFTGTLADLRGRIRFVAEDLVVRGVELGSAELHLEQEQSLRARLDAIDPRAGTLVATLEAEGRLAPLLLARRGAAALRSLRGRLAVEGRDLDLAPLALLADVNRARGVVAIDAIAEGSLLAPEPVGSLSLRDGAVELVGGRRYEPIALDAVFDRGLVEARVSARAPGDGSLLAAGRFERRDGPDPFRFAVEAQLFPIGGPGGVSARVSGEGSLEGRLGREGGIEATLRVPRARILLPPTPPRELQPISRPSDVVLVTGPEAILRRRRQMRAAAERALPVDLRIEAPRRIFVVGEDVDAELGVQLRIRRDDEGQLSGVGEVEARRGRVQVLGRHFVLEEGRATWGGGPLDDPMLSLTARYEARAATAWVDVTGRLREPRVGLRSEPALPESQIALLIATGRTTLPGQTAFGFEEAPAEIDPAGTAVSVAGSFAAQRLRQALGPRLPLDVLTFQSAGQSSTLEAGAYLSDRLYIGYLRNFLPEEAENYNEVRASYELSRTVSIESRFGDRGAAGVDVIWEKQVATPAQQRARRAAWEERTARRDDGATEAPAGEGAAGEGSRPAEAEGEAAD